MKRILILTLALCLWGCSNDKAPKPGPKVDTENDHTPIAMSRTGHVKDPHERFGRKYWRPSKMYRAISEGTVPDSWDWRAKGMKVRIHDQGQCGSCWADASTTCAMAEMLIFEKITAELSVQEIVSCDRNNYGCQGGNWAGAFGKQYGLVSEAEFPYRAADVRCPSGMLKKAPTFKPHDFVYIGAPGRSPTEEEVQAAIYQFGYVGVSFGADNAFANSHTEGVFSSCGGTPVNHEVAAFSYDKKQHAIGIQNSWSESFGRRSDPGTLVMQWGCNSLAQDAGYWVPTSAPCQPPKAHLPAEYVVNQGDDVTLAVRAEAAISYEWFEGATSLGTGPLVTLQPNDSTEYRLVAKNACGEAEIKTLVTIKK